MKNKLPSHLEYCSETAEKVLNFLKSQKKEDHQKFLQIIQKAKETYIKPTLNFFTGYPYRIKRKRGAEVDYYIAQFEKTLTSTLEIRLNAFLTLITHGEWFEGSYNTQLFEGLLGHFEPEYVDKSIFRDLKNTLKFKIPEFILSLKFTPKELDDHKEITEGFLEFLSSKEPKTERKIISIIEVCSQKTGDQPELTEWLDLFKNNTNSWERMSYLHMLMGHEEPYIKAFKYALVQEIFLHVLPNYLMDKPDQVLVLNNLILMIQNMLPQYILSLKFSQHDRQGRREEIQNGIAKNVRQKLNYVHLFSDKNNAIQKALNEPELAVFHLQINDKWTRSETKNASDKWDLFWIDPYGNSHKLKVSPELAGQLRNNMSILECNPAKLPAIHSQCIQLKNEFMDKIKFKVDPLVDAQILHSTFVLKRGADSAELIWFSHTGKSRNIDLSLYGNLKNWLDKQSNWNENSALAFKNFLPGIDTKNKLVCENNIREKLENRYSGTEKKMQQEPGKITADKQEALERLFNMRKQTTPRSLEGLFFAPSPPEKLPDLIFSQTQHR